MRPIKLTLSAFCSYSGEQSIDMSALGSGGMYLVTGDTGAGKTTIFDAISFALFGAASGDNREASMLRSKYAADDVQTFVELEFEYCGRRYIIRRSPEYMRPSRRGDGMSKSLAQAQMIFPDGRIVAKTGDVNKAVRELIGVDRSQFAQIAMIAQGDFLKLLLAKTEQRNEIFRQIFKTERYQRLQARLREEASALEQRRKLLCSGVRQYIGGIVCDNAGELHGELELLRSLEFPGADSANELLCRLIERDEAAYSADTNRLERLEKELEAVNALFGKAQELDKARKGLAEAQAAIEQGEPRLAALQEDLRVLEARRPEADAIVGRIATERDLLPGYEEYTVCTASLALVQRNLSALLSANERKRAAISEQANRLEELKEEHSALKGAGERCERITVEGTKLAHLKEQYSLLLRQTRELTAKQSELSIARKSYIDAQKQAEEQRIRHERMNRLFLDGQAGVLASALLDGERCPVCGSVEHPAPARLTAGAPSEAALQRAKADTERSQNKAAELSAEAGRLSGVVQTLFDELAAGCAPFGVDPLSPKLESELVASIGEQDSQLKKLRDQLKAENLRVKRYSELESIIPEVEKSLSDAREQLAAAEKDAITAQSEQRSLAQTAEQCRAKLRFESINEAKEHIALLQKEHDGILGAIADATEATANCRSVLDDLRGKRGSLLAQLKGAEQLDVEGLSAQRNELGARKKAISGRLTSLASALQTNKGIFSRLGEQFFELDRLDRRAAWVGSLSETANGRVGKKEKIMLETYVQTVYFDRIIYRANLRLLSMSDGQYELIRADRAEKLNSQSGLELGVIDHCNGSRRSVRSLSGGESFKASLALALGLSDEVQSSAGGIRLDSMFIDEGFGTLSGNDLDQAITVLAGLSDGSRLVGIISHVAELKERIDRQIVVTKTSSGESRARVVV